MALLLVVKRCVPLELEEPGREEEYEGEEEGKEEEELQPELEG